MEKKKPQRQPYPSVPQPEEEGIQLLYAAPPPRLRVRKQPPIQAVYAAPLPREKK